MLKAINGPAQAQMLNQISQSLAKIIPLERQAFGLDEPEPQETSEETFFERLSRETNGTGFRPVEDRSAVN